MLNSWTLREFYKYIIVVESTNCQIESNWFKKGTTNKQRNTTEKATKQKQISKCKQSNMIKHAKKSIDNEELSLKCDCSWATCANHRPFPLCSNKPSHHLQETLGRCCWEPRFPLVLLLQNALPRCFSSPTCICKRPAWNDANKESKLLMKSVDRNFEPTWNILKFWTYKRTPGNWTSSFTMFGVTLKGRRLLRLYDGASLAEESCKETGSSCIRSPLLVAAETSSSMCSQHFSTRHWNVHTSEKEQTSNELIVCQLHVITAVHASCVEAQIKQTKILKLLTSRSRSITVPQFQCFALLCIVVDCCAVWLCEVLVRQKLVEPRPDQRHMIPGR